MATYGCGCLSVFIAFSNVVLYTVAIAMMMTPWHAAGSRVCYPAIESDIWYELVLVIWYTIQTIKLEIAFFYKFSLKEIRRDLVIPVILQKVREKQGEMPSHP